MSSRPTAIALVCLACASSPTPRARSSATPADAVAAYHDGFNRADPARIRSAIAGGLMMSGGAYSGDPADWQAHQFLAGAGVDRWIAFMLREAGPFENRWDVVHVSLRGDAAIVVTRETGRNRFREWRDETVSWELGRAGDAWRIVGFFIRDLRNPETDKARAETLAAIAALGGQVEIADAPGKPVTKIDLHETAVTDELLEKLALFPELEALDLRKTAITDRGAAHLAALRRLRTLNLFRTAIGDATLARLAGLRELEVLLVGGTRISDDGLGQLLGLARLRKLSVFDTAVGDAGVARLSALPRLEILLIGSSRVTDAGARELQRARPALRFSEPT